MYYILLHAGSKLSIPDRDILTQRFRLSGGGKFYFRYLIIVKFGYN
jgi:hypothetical protein